MKYSKIKKVRGEIQIIVNFNHLGISLFNKKPSKLYFKFLTTIETECKLFAGALD